MRVRAFTYAGAAAVLTATPAVTGAAHVIGGTGFTSTVGVKVTGVSSVRSLSALGACCNRACDDLTDVDQNGMVLGSNAIAAAVWSPAGTATS